MDRAGEQGQMELGDRDVDRTGGQGWIGLEGRDG
jgi:hypothetical protein